MAGKNKDAAKPRSKTTRTGRPAAAASEIHSEAPIPEAAPTTPRAAFEQLDLESRRNLEAVTASVTAATEGAQAMAVQAAEFAQQTLQRYVEAAQAIGGARSPQEAIEAQLSHRAAAIQAYVAELNRAAAALTSVVNASLRPLNERADSLIKKK